MLFWVKHLNPASFQVIEAMRVPKRPRVKLKFITRAKNGLL